MPIPTPNEAATPRNRVLHVEDREDLRCLIRTILETEGYEVTGAENGEEGIRKLAKDDYDLILLDMQMPVKTGDYVIKWVVGNRPHLTSRILLSTGSPMTPWLEVLLGELQIPLLAKPFRIGELLEQMRSMIAARQEERLSAPALSSSYQRTAS